MGDTPDYSFKVFQIFLLSELTCMPIQADHKLHNTSDYYLNIFSAKTARRSSLNDKSVFSAGEEGWTTALGALIRIKPDFKRYKVIQVSRPCPQPLDVLTGQRPGPLAVRTVAPRRGARLIHWTVSLSWLIS
jgi:hypothetical protein